MARRRILLACVVSFGILGVGCDDGTSETALGELRFALPVADWWTAAPFVNRGSRAEFEKEGVSVVTLEVNSGLASKNAVVAGTADVGLSAATPLVLAAARDEQIVILGTYLQSSGVVGLVQPKSVLPNELPPEPVAVISSTISESFLYRYLEGLGKEDLMERDEIDELHVRPPDIPGAIRTRSASSAVIWEPFLSFAAEENDLVIQRGDGTFDVQLYLITRPAVLQSRPQAVEGFVRAVGNSCAYLMNNSREAREEIEAFFDFRPSFLADTWPLVTYGLQYNVPRMKAEFEREAEVARALGYLQEMPEMEYMFHQDRFQWIEGR